MLRCPCIQFLTGASQLLPALCSKHMHPHATRGLPSSQRAGSQTGEQGTQQQRLTIAGRAEVTKDEDKVGDQAANCPTHATLSPWVVPQPPRTSLSSIRDAISVREQSPAVSLPPFDAPMCSSLPGCPPTRRKRCSQPRTPLSILPSSQIWVQMRHGAPMAGHASRSDAGCSNPMPASPQPRAYSPLRVKHERDRHADAS